MLSAVMTLFALGVPLTVITVLGLLLNLYILMLIILTKQLQTANNFLLLHLGVVDSLLCALFLLFSAPSLLGGKGAPSAGSGWWGEAGAPCSLHGFLFTLLHPVALWTVCGLNCDRYYAISAPLHYAAVVSTRKVAAGLLAAWLLALALCLPPLFLVAPYRYSPGLGGCAPDFTLGEGAIWYSALYTGLTLLLPSALILVCNIKVLMIARYHRHRIASAIFEVTLSAQVTITHQRNPFTHPPVLAPPKIRNRNALATVIQLLGSLLVLYFPYYGVILWESSSSTLLGHKVNPALVTLASTLLTCSPPVNGLLYGIKSKILRKTFQNYWRKQMSKSEMNQEIQARTPSACGSRRPSLTPLGLFGRPASTHLQRRLSEVLLDPHRTGATNATRPKIQRIASELDWRPTSGFAFSDGASFMMRSRSYRERINQPHNRAVSCNTLQVPNPDPGEVLPALAADELARKLKNFRAAIISDKSNEGSSEGVNSLCDGSTRSVGRPTLSSANLFLQRVFGVGGPHGVDSPVTAHSLKRAAAIQTVLASTPRRSPRILITRAFSEESDHHTPPTPGSPTPVTPGDFGRQYSTSATSLLDRKWRKYQYREQPQIDVEFPERQPLKITACTSSYQQDSGKSSGSSSTEDEEEDDDAEDNDDDNSDASSGRLYFSLDANSGAPLCCNGASNSDSGEGMTVPAVDDDVAKRIPSSYVLSWPTTRRNNNPCAGMKPPVPSRVHLTKSSADVTTAREFVL